MKELQHGGQSQPESDPQENPVVRELDGYLQLGMKREALRLARQCLKLRPVSGAVFDASLGAILGLMELHTARALLAVRSGLEALEVLKADFDPELELKLPGNNRQRWEKAQRTLRQLEKKPGEILPPNHWDDFGAAKPSAEA